MYAVQLQRSGEAAYEPEQQLGDAVHLSLDATVSRHPKAHCGLSQRMEAVLDVVQKMPTQSIYRLLTANAKHFLGLAKGFVFILALERCADREEMVDLARRFAAMLERDHGSMAATYLGQLVRTELGDRR